MIFIKKIIRPPFNFFWSRESQLPHQQKANKLSTIINEPLRKRLFSFIKRHKKLILAIFIFLLVFFSFYQVSLAAIDAVIEKLFTIGKTMLFIATIPLLAMAFFELTEVLLWLATTPRFLGLDFTMANPIINLGWTVVRDFVNMFFILILVVIGLGIALRLKEYDIKKSLPKFIAAVLLVNFGPVILALIAEIAETFMNFFLAEVRGLAGVAALVRLRFWAGMVILTGVLLSLAATLFVPGAWIGALLVGGVGMELLAELLATTLVALVAGIVFILFASLLLVRQLAIWILIIISPVAFLLWVLPGSKMGGYAKMWWQQFLQWSFIGVPTAFFLYLAAHLAGTPMPGIVAPILKLFVIAGFLIIGFFIAIKTAPMGASFVTNFGLSTTKRAAGFVGGRALERVAPALKKDAIEHARRIEERAAGGGWRSWDAKVRQRLGMQAFYSKMAGGMDKVIEQKEKRKMSILEGLWGKNLQHAKEGDVNIDPKDEAFFAAFLQKFNEVKDSKERNWLITRLSKASAIKLSEMADPKQRDDLITTAGISNLTLALEMVKGSSNKFNDRGKITDPDRIMQNIYKEMNREQFSNLKNINDKAFQAAVRYDQGRMVSAIQDGLDKNPALLEALAKISLKGITSVKVRQVLKDRNLTGFLGK